MALRPPPLRSATSKSGWSVGGNRGPASTTTKGSSRLKSRARARRPLTEGYDMTEVRIRHEMNSDSALLADVPFDQLGTVIPTIKSWGVDLEQPEMFGHFVINEMGAHFEVVICDTDGAA